MTVRTVARRTRRSSSWPAASASSSARQARGLVRVDLASSRRAAPGGGGAEPRGREVGVEDASRGLGDRRQADGPGAAALIVAHARQPTARSAPSGCAAAAQSASVGNERDPHVALAAGAEERARARRRRRARSSRSAQRLGVAVAGHAAPAEERRRPADVLEADRVAARARARRAWPGSASRVVLDVRLVAPRGDRRALHERLRRHAERRAHLLHRRDQQRVAGDEPRAVARHRRALGERVEREHVRRIVDLQHRRGRARRRARSRCRPRRRRARRPRGGSARRARA